jgi:hypothetical protein
MYAERMEHRIHLEQPAPPYCAACHQAVPDQRHVDFGASFDGPMLPALSDTVGTVGHSIDEVVICETCIAAAGRLLGLEDASDLREQLDRALSENDVLQDRLAGQRDSVTHALDTLRAGVTGGALPPSRPNPLLPGGGVPAPSSPARSRKGRKTPV